MALEPYGSHEGNRALTVVSEGVNLPAPVNTDVVSAGAVAAGLLAAGLVAGGVTLGRALVRSVAQARRRDEQRTIVTHAGDRDAAVAPVVRVTRVTRVSMVVVEEWTTRGRAGGS